METKREVSGQRGKPPAYAPDMAQFIYIPHEVINHDLTFLSLLLSSADLLQ